MENTKSQSSVDANAQKAIAGVEVAAEASAKVDTEGRAEGRSEGAEDAEGAEGASQNSCCCHHKETPRSMEFQADLQKRLNRAIGQLNGVKNMLDDNRYCGDVLIQLAAAESAIHSVSSMLLQDHLKTCVVEQVRRGNDEVIDEVVQLIKRFAR